MAEYCQRFSCRLFAPQEKKTIICGKRIGLLQNQLSNNSRNYSNPPSQDVNRPGKCRSEERVAKRPVGGQKGQGGKFKDRTALITPFQLG